MPGEMAPSHLSSKPSRSEELPAPNELLQISDAVRQKFDQDAPKRPPKPVRSESLDHTLSDSAFDAEIPEYIKFQGLLQSEPLIRGFSDSPSEEFVETEYYKGLNAVDRSLHHTTGSGFIQVESNGMPNLNVGSSGLVRTRSGCNPATNDWVPSPDMVFPSSDKPPRSDP